MTLFLALVAGSALRPHYTANSLPEPAAWTHTVKDVQPDYNYSHPLSATPVLKYLKSGSRAHPAPTSRKPFRYVWMTHDLPSNWIRCRRKPTGRSCRKLLLQHNFSRAAPRGVPRRQMLSTDIRHPCSASFAAEVGRTALVSFGSGLSASGRTTLLRAAASIPEGSHGTRARAESHAASRALPIRPDDTKPCAPDQFSVPTLGMGHGCAHKFVCPIRQKPEVRCP